LNVYSFNFFTSSAGFGKICKRVILVLESNVVFKVHFAYSIVLAVTISLTKFHTLVKAVSLYQPAKVYPILVGSDGAIIFVL
jgi:hypothetical protein